MSEPSGVRTRSQHRREAEEEHADVEMATSAAEQCEGEKQPPAGANDETRDEQQSQSQVPGAEAPTATSVEDKMQTLAQLLMNMSQTMNQKLDQQRQKLDLKLDQQAQIKAQQTQRLDQQAQAQAQQAQALNMKLDQQFSRLEQDIGQLSQQTGREISRLDEEISTLN